MLKMMAKGDREDGRPVTIVMLGLTYGNLERLKKGQPIKFSGDTAGLTDDIEFIIFAGESERSMQKEMMDLVGPKTKLKIDPRLAD